MMFIHLEAPNKKEKQIQTLGKILAKHKYTRHEKAKIKAMQ